MAERTPSKPTSTCRSWSKRAASLKSGLDRLKQEFNRKVETLFGEFSSKEVVEAYPVPTSPPRTPTPAANAPFPKPATPPGGCARTPVGQHDHEASGSNHTSNHTSEYFDAKDPSEYLQQHQIPDYAEFNARLHNRKQYGSEHSQQGYEHAQQGIERPQYRFERPQQGTEHSQQGFEHSLLGNELSQFGSEYPQLGLGYPQFGSEHPQFGTEYYQHGFEHPQPGIEHLQQGFERPHPGLEDQLAGSFDNMLLNTPTASHVSPDVSHPHPHPWDDHPFLNPVAPVSVHHHLDPTVRECYYSGELNPSWFQLDDATGSHATSTAQQQQTTTLPGYHGGMSMKTGETGDSRESLMDTAGTSTTSPYILPPVAEEKPSILPPPFNKIYVELRRIARGDEVPFASARMGRGMRVLGKAFCYTLRLRKTAMRVRLAKAQRKRIREPQRQQKPRLHCIKRMRPGDVPTQPMAPGVSTQSTTERRYKGITLRNGHWNAEIRVSACKEKVWIGTFPSEKEAALALDAGYYHCTEKWKSFNFPQFVNHLGESQYQTVLALCKTGRKDEATKLVKNFAAAHAAEFGAP